MSVVEVGAYGTTADAPEFERTPPQDVAAEQSVLGGMLLSKDAIADVVESLSSVDFYRPAHATIYDAICDLYGRGEPADAVTISAELTKRGEIGKVGGAPYLHTLISSVPTAANAGYYARIVCERAILRRLVEAGTRIVQMGYGGQGGDVADLVDRAQAEVYDVTEQRTSEDYLPLEQILPHTLDELEAISSRDGTMVGVPTGFRDLDELTNGLHPGQLIIAAARPAVGKALALDTPLPTPTGWTTMGEVRVGDQLIGADGKPAVVVAATPVMLDRRCYAVRFSDGSTIVADAEHQWFTETRASRRSAQQAATGYNRYRNQRTFGSVKTTEEIAGSVHCPTADGRLNHSVPVADALNLPEADLPLDPYVLGVWLGDGHSAGARITTADPEIVASIEATGLVVKPGAGLTYGLRFPDEPGSHTVVGFLRELGVLNNKHIPLSYLRASRAQRRALMAGLLDTDGMVNGTRTSVSFDVTNAQLARDTQELALSLGYRATMTTRRVRGRTEASSICYRVHFAPQEQVFRLSRKAALHRQTGAPIVRERFITEVRAVPSVPTRCVQVDNDSHLYLAGRTMIPTHNSTWALDCARNASIKHGMTSCIFSLEMSRNEITMRLLSAEARVPLHHMRSGTMSDDDWSRLARRMGEVAEAPLFVDDSPNLTMMEIRAKARRLKQRHDLRLIIVDYLQLMTSPKRTESRQVEVSEMSRSMKLLAKELDVPVIAISQLNRQPEQRADKKPQLSDLRESGSLEQDADMVVLLHREDLYERVAARRRSRPHRGQEPQRPHPDRDGCLPGPLLALRGHVAHLSPGLSPRPVCHRCWRGFPERARGSPG